MSRTPEDIAELFAYGRWATAQTLASAAALTADEFIRPGGFNFVQPTAVLLRETLADGAPIVPARPAAAEHVVEGGVKRSLP